ncbi:MAG: hypothetical protein EPO11_08050 [Gammaproteobacteria bacterium]|nr:MAG: hypothetical protein EPO11_08050 [Gammaproteobacteria bacterium]
MPRQAIKMRESITKICRRYNYKVIDAAIEVTGRDFLLKIWKLIASTPISVAINHEEFPLPTIMNIYYELGIARTMGKETMIVKSIQSIHPSDLIRDEYIEFNKNFDAEFSKFLDHVNAQAEHYELMAEQLENNPLLSIDYLKRAYLITGNVKLKKKAMALLKNAKLKKRAKNSVEMLAVRF